MIKICRGIQLEVNGHVFSHLPSAVYKVTSNRPNFRYVKIRRDVNPIW